jgi:hypothetical protein
MVARKLPPVDVPKSWQWPFAMKIHHGDVLIQRLDEGRYAVAVGGVVHYVGSREECERRVAILMQKNDRTAQDEALLRVAIRATDKS